MLFNSISFLLFFPLVTLLYFVAPFPFRWIVLLIASCIFYMFFIPVYILILFYLILVDYFSGIYIEKLQGKQRTAFLFLSILSNLGVLFFFKYFNFFSGNVSSVAHLVHWNYSLPLLKLILPIGLSFHTFQSLSYVIEVYKKKQKAEKHFGIYALYVMFYPQLVAGPIERPQHMLHQFHEEHPFSESQVSQGLKRMLWGLFKKVIIADRLALLVNQVYATPHQYIGLPLILATVAFAIQIYCDFSGYTDIAIGAAQVMGFKLVENFNYPYLATSIPDFWRRWHMSLYLWFRDYVYIPLGGNRSGLSRQIFNILIVFTITGLWHGAAWTFIVWGLLHGIYMAVSVLISKFSLLPKVTNGLVQTLFSAVQVCITFIFVCIGWVFFRATTISDAVYILFHSVLGLGSFFVSLLKFRWNVASVYLFNQGSGLGLNATQLWIAAVAVAILIVFEYLERNQFIPQFNMVVRWGMYLAFVLILLNLGTANAVPFIYFQF